MILFLPLCQTSGQLTAQEDYPVIHGEVEWSHLCLLLYLLEEREEGGFSLPTLLSTPHFLNALQF